MASYNYGKQLIVHWVKDNFPFGASCLDVGACDGKWFNLLGDYLTMDACEIYQPNIQQYNLAYRYRRVFWGDIADLEYEHYDLVIFGDVIEHMFVGKAQRVIDYAKQHFNDMIIAVPYQLEQPEIYGNKWEKHIQDDLTPEIFDARYPNFEIIWANDEYAYYHRKL